MCDFCEKFIKLESMDSESKTIELFNKEYCGTVLLFDNSDGNCLPGQIKINYCPICGETVTMCKGFDCQYYEAHEDGPGEPYNCYCSKYHKWFDENESDALSCNLHFKCPGWKESFKETLKKDNQ